MIFRSSYSNDFETRFNCDKTRFGLFLRRAEYSSGCMFFLWRRWIFFGSNTTTSKLAVTRIILMKLFLSLCMTRPSTFLANCFLEETKIFWNEK